MLQRVARDGALSSSGSHTLWRVCWCYGRKSGHNQRRAVLSKQAKRLVPVARRGRVDSSGSD